MHSSSRFFTVALALALFGCQAPGRPVAPAQSAAPTVNPTAAPAGTAAATAETPRATFGLTGVIYDEAANVVGGAKVEAGGVSAETSSDGRYRLEVPAGKYQVTARKNGWTSRTQAVDLQADRELNFGGPTPHEPFFLSDAPEIARVEVHEEAPGGPLTISCHLSESLPAESRAQFADRLEVRAGAGTPFLSAGALERHTKTTTSWDEAGAVFTLRYAGPYLASGQVPAEYSVALRQARLERNDPATGDPRWEDMGILDAGGQALGRGRAGFSFLRSPLGALVSADLLDKNWGSDMPTRRWNLTHTATHTFQAMKDKTQPTLVRVDVRADAMVGDQATDELTLVFSEPMQVARNQQEGQFTRLSPKGNLVRVLASDFASGAGAASVPTQDRITLLRFDSADPRRVFVHFSSGTFKDKKWVEVSLGPDAVDPAGNAPAESRAVWSAI